MRVPSTQNSTRAIPSASTAVAAALSLDVNVLPVCGRSSVSTGADGGSTVPDPASGGVPLPASGGRVGAATVSQDAEAPVVSALPAASVARTTTVWLPRPRPENVAGLLHGAG